jgi:Tfp pilus assembly protein PilO
LVVDKVILGPITGGLDELKVQRDVLVAEVGEAQSLFERRRLLEPRYKKMLSDGFRHDTEAESRVLRSLREWSQTAALTLSSVKPERVASDQGLKEMTFAVAGTGTLRSVAQFLWQIETAALPIKVKNMQIGSASEAGDSMSLQLKLSALYLDDQPSPSAAVKPEVNDEDDF